LYLDDVFLRGGESVYLEISVKFFVKIPID